MILKLTVDWTVRNTRQIGAGFQKVKDAAHNEGALNPGAARRLAAAKERIARQKEMEAKLRPSEPKPIEAEKPATLPVEAPTPEPVKAEPVAKEAANVAARAAPKSNPVITKNSQLVLLSSWRRPMKLAVAFVVVAIVAFGCGTWVGRFGNDRYEIAVGGSTSSIPFVYRLDRRTGKIWWALARAAMPETPINQDPKDLTP